MHQTEMICYEKFIISYVPKPKEFLSHENGHRLLYSVLLLKLFIIKNFLSNLKLENLFRLIHNKKFGL